MVYRRNDLLNIWSLGELPANEATKDVESNWVAPADELAQPSFNFEEPDH